MAGLASISDRTEAAFLDFRVHLFGPRPAPSELILVAIDDATVAEAGGFPLDRRRLAHLIRRIRESGARALGVDLLLVDATEPVADASLAEGLSSLPTVIAAAGQFEPPRDGASPLPLAASVLLPLPEFSAAAEIGLVNIVTDQGGTPRHMPLVFQTPHGLTPSFALGAVGLFEGDPVPLGPGGVRMAGGTQPLDLRWHLALRFYGPRGTIDTISARTLFDDGATDPRLAGRFVLLGATATGIGDRFNSPFDPVLPGVEVLATGIANLLDQTGLIRDASVRRVDAGAALLLALAAVAALSILPLAPGTMVFLLCLAAWMVVTVVVFAQGYWLSMALPLAASLPPFGVLVLLSQVLDRRESRRLAVAQAELARFQAPALARRIAMDPMFLSRPVAHEAAIMFIDLSGFSGASERLGPTATRDLLKALHTRIADGVARQDGLILDFMGDGAMIGFGIPDAGPSSSRQALTAAFVLVATIRGWIESSEWAAENLGVRVGLHYGPIVLSRLGHDTHQQIAATGDCVNVASRLMEVAKTHHACIAASTALLERAGIDWPEMPAPDSIRHVEIRGRAQPLNVAMWQEVPGHLN